MSTSTQNISQVSIAKQSLSETTEVKSSLPTWQDIEKAIVAILRAGVAYKLPKDKSFMSWYKRQLDELHSAEDPDLHIFEKAIDLFPTEDSYREKIEIHKSYYKKHINVRKAIQKYYELCYNIVKESFSTEEEIDEELNEWLNS
jgi:hypothetical protein